MADDPPPPGPGEDRAWDEYDWERFFQQQDRKTERYLRLLDQYRDHPDRDQLIAREMGWQHLLDETGKNWSDDLEELFSGLRPPPPNAPEAVAADPDAAADGEEIDPDEEHAAEQAESTADAAAIARFREDYKHHPLYQTASDLPPWIEKLFGGPAGLARHEAAIRLSAAATLTSAKLAAALGDGDTDELGMTIAYLKRALRAVTGTLEAAGQCEQEGLLDAGPAEELRSRIFQVRDAVVSLMGDYRREWRRRYRG